MKISDISDIDDVRHDIGNDRYIGFEPIYHGNIRYMAHAYVSLIFRKNIRDISEIYLNDHI